MQRNVPLAPFTTLGIGGPAKFFAEPANVDEIRAALDWASSHGEQVFILAGGSNVLIADEGFDGVVLRLKLRGVEADDGWMRVAAGEKWDDVVAKAVARNWAGVECLSGIPGTTGATPIQNVGAYGQEVSETIVSVEVLERATGRVMSLTNAECEFGYRSSRFKRDSKHIVLSVAFKLRPGGEPALRYPELQQFAGRDLAGIREAVIAVRRKKGMVLDPNDRDTRSDGSFFMNPIVSQVPGDMPHFPAGDKFKLSAAWLIEHAGFQKGFVHGNVGLSSKHTLAIINRGGGTAREVLELVRMIQDAVREKFGVPLHPEPNFVGF
ncbi:MAG TPA: UDP-N-acetylmuramate dehydrogenase [Thermoanaerobaculia bacterium]